MTRSVLTSLTSLALSGNAACLVADASLDSVGDGSPLDGVGPSLGDSGSGGDSDEGADGGADGGVSGDGAGGTGADSGTTGGDTGTTGVDTDTESVADSEGDTGATGDDTGSTGGESSSSSDGSEGNDSDEGGGTDPDVGTPEEKCKNVDLLFVIDNSGSMHDQQEALVRSFPGFVRDMRDKLEQAKSYRVGVTTTDKYLHHAPPCSKVLGSMVQQTGGEESSESDCGPFSTGLRYMDETDDLESKFACVAKVGIDGSPSERPAAALLAALSPDLQRPSACNDGFLRKDALLVVVIITDEEDVISTGDPMQWYSDLVALKDGHEEHVVMLSLINKPPPSSCLDTIPPALKLIEFTRRFTHAHIGDVCAANYEDYFREAVDVVDLACDDFEPPN